MIRKSFWLGPLAMLLLVGDAQATISYGYVAQVQGLNGDGTVTAGGTYTVNLYLQETVTGKDTSLLQSEGGLYGAGVSVVQTSGSGATITSLSANSLTEPDGFTGNNHLAISQGTPTQGTLVKLGNVGVTSITANGNQASMSLTTSDTASIPPAPGYNANATGVNLVLLGSLTISVGSSANATFTIQALKSAPNVPGVTFNQTYGDEQTATNYIDLDQTNNSGFTYIGAVNNPSTFQIATPSTGAVPEPSSMLLCGFAALGMGFGAWRRRKLKLQAETPAVEETQLAV